MKKPLTIIQDAIAEADSSYFFENYTKQAQAVIQALEKAGYSIHVANTATIPAELWEKAADQMKTGRIRPAEHVKDVYEVVLRLLKA